MVRADRVASVVPSAAGGVAGGRAGVAELRGPRLLSDAPDLRAAIAAKRTRWASTVRHRRAGRHSESRPRLKVFLADGAHGDMAWLAANPERRADPRTLWSDVRSVVMLGVNYGPDEIRCRF